LTAFGAEVASIVLGSDNNHVKLSLPFNQQTVVLEGVGSAQISQIQMLKTSGLSVANV
jgi:hypothetical protein